MSKNKIPLNPSHPERVCWGCNQYCAANDLRCGNGTIRTQHPVELFGEDWFQWELNNGPQQTAGDDQFTATKQARPSNDIG